MTPTPLLDLAIAPVAGYLGTKAMEPVSNVAVRAREPG